MYDIVSRHQKIQICNIFIKDKKDERQDCDYCVPDPQGRLKSWHSWSLYYAFVSSDDTYPNKSANAQGHVEKVYEGDVREYF
jgi:hypothetical protein